MKYRGRFLRFAIVPAFLAALAAWALATPVGSSPDEDFHIANIYCMADESKCRSKAVEEWPYGFPGWPPDPAARTSTSPLYATAKDAYPDLWQYPAPRRLPCYVLNGSNWYAPNSTVAADCLNGEDPTDNTPASVDRLSYYPPFFYATMAPFTSDTIRKSVVTWRLVNITIAVVLAACSLGLAIPRYRRTIAIGWLVASVPFGLFLISSANPSAWAIIGTAAMLGPALALLSRPWERRGSSIRIAFVAICGLMAAGSRSEGAFPVAISAIVVLILAGRIPIRRSNRIALGLGLGGLLVAAVFVVRESEKLRDVVETGLDSAFADPATQVASFWDALLAAPGLYSQVHSPLLGWLEIGMPAAVGVLAGAAFWGAGFYGLSTFFRRKLIAVVLLALVMILVPAIVLLNGQDLQARYFLPLVYVFAFVLLVPSVRDSLPEMSRAQKGALVLGLGIANSLALLQVTVRYVSGLTMGATNPRAFAAHPVPDWWWDYWISPFTNWVFGSVAFAVGCYLLLRNPGPLYPAPTLQGIPKSAEPPPASDSPFPDSETSPGATMGTPVMPTREN